MPFFEVYKLFFIAKFREQCTACYRTVIKEFPEQKRLTDSHVHIQLALLFFVADIYLLPNTSSRKSYIGCLMKKKYHSLFILLYYYFISNYFKLLKD